MKFRTIVKNIINENKQKSIVVAFGRFNPPTIGHKILIDKVIKLASQKGIEHKIFVSKTHDSKKNPVPYSEKIKFLKKSFPDANISNDKDLIDPFKMLEYLSDKGYKEIYLVAGSDRVKIYDEQIKPYINAPGKSINLTFTTFETISAGERDPDSDTATGVSASKAREMVKNNNLNQFSQVVSLSKKDTTELFNLIKRNLK